MYEYKFIKIDLEGVFPLKKPSVDYHKVIEQHAKEGWKLLQIFAPVTAAGPFSAYFELIFEREKIDK